MGERYIKDDMLKNGYRRRQEKAYRRKDNVRAKIGSFGELVFSVSANTVKTFDGMSWDFSADYATHDRHIKADLLEYMGPGIETISFSMVLSVFLGVNPLKEIKKLRKMVRKGYVGRLVIGGKVYGSYKWVMQKGTVDFQRFDNKGNLLAAKVKVTLKEYPRKGGGVKELVELPQQ